MIDQTHIRLLVLSTLLLGTTVVLEADRHQSAVTDTSVFSQPPAYLHAPAALAFDLSGLPSSPRDETEAALLASVESALDVESRAHTHLSLANYYKMRGMMDQAAVEKRKADYWRRIAKYVTEEPRL